MILAVCKDASESLRILLSTESKGKVSSTAKSNVVDREVRIILTKEYVVQTRTCIVRVISI